VSIKLYSYWRSSAAYRVRIALNLKNLDYEIVPVSLLPGEDEHRQDDYRKRNPQMLVPFLEDGDVRTGQSLAILEYLEETYVDPSLLPYNAQARAVVRSFCSSMPGMRTGLPRVSKPRKLSLARMRRMGRSCSATR